jgi:hypothetical protein
MHLRQGAHPFSQVMHPISKGARPLRLVMRHFKCLFHPRRQKFAPKRLFGTETGGEKSMDKRAVPA